MCRKKTHCHFVFNVHICCCKCDGRLEGGVYYYYSVCPSNSHRLLLFCVSIMKTNHADKMSLYVIITSSYKQTIILI